MSAAPLPAPGAWVTDPTGAAPARPIILWPLSPLWALAVVASDGWRGSFPAFLDRLVATTGLAISGIQLVSDALVSAFWGWVGDQYGARTFAPTPPP
jgi:hypothetical protein